MVLFIRLKLHISSEFPQVFKKKFLKIILNLLSAHTGEVVAVSAGAPSVVTKVGKVVVGTQTGQQDPATLAMVVPSSQYRVGQTMGSHSTPLLKQVQRSHSPLFHELPG